MTRHPREQLGAWIDGELATDEAAAVERHLRECTECTREAALIRTLGGAMRTMTEERPDRSVWAGVHRRITQPAGWLMLLAGVAIWVVLAAAGWWRATFTWEWLAGSAVAAGLILLAVGVGHEQVREWRETRYKDIEQ
jgi:anti-sigma factor RsiW